MPHRQCAATCVLLRRRAHTSVASTGLQSPLLRRSAFVTSQRSYFPPYADDLVPAGATTSRFQSSTLPSERDRLVRAYAFAPLYAARTPCCALGFAVGARAVMPYKAALREAVAVLLDCSVADVELGVLRQTKEMMLHRRGLDESPRLADDEFACADWQQRRCTRYARMPVVARTLLPVYLSDELVAHRVSSDGVDERDGAGDVDEESTLLQWTRVLHAHGERVRAAVADCMRSRKRSTGAVSAAAVDKVMWHDEEAAVAAATGTQARVRAQAAVLCDLGVVYCEVRPADESGYVFDKLRGVAVDADDADAIFARWQQQQQTQ